MSGCSSDHVKVSSVVNTIADYEVYKTLDSLEKDAENIVEAEYTGERVRQDIEHQGEIMFSLSKSNVKVLKSYKGNLKRNDKIQVYEEGVIKDDRYINSSGYKLMNEKGTYLLFLRTNQKDDAYVMIGGPQGKYDLSLSKRPDQSQGALAAFADPAVEYMGDERELERFYKMKEFVMQKYTH